MFGARSLRLLTGGLALLIGQCLTHANAAVTYILSGGSFGELMGARGVVVGTHTYSVEFKEGTCIAVFGGCDEPQDFAFQNEADALAAGAALLDSVFVDSGAFRFDSSPGSTYGCISIDEVNRCRVYTPYRTDSSQIYASSTFNTEPPYEDFTYLWSSESLSFDTTDCSDQVGGECLGVFDVWAKWSRESPIGVHEPPSVALLGVAALALGWTRRRRPATPTATG
jgi:MYXO-CTERM domain-containing protein